MLTGAWSIRCIVRYRLSQCAMPAAGAVHSMKKLVVVAQLTSFPRTGDRSGRRSAMVRLGVVLMVGIFASPVTAGCATGDLNTNAPDLPLSGSGGAGGLPGPSGASILAGGVSGGGRTAGPSRGRSGVGSA